MILIYITIVCGATNLCDLENRALNWSHTNDGWSSLDENGRISTICGCGVHNISIFVNGPCNVHFDWGISNGYNSLVLLDNNNDSGYRLPLGPQNVGPHNSITKSNDYQISDNISHELKWSHRNPHSESTANISNISVCDLVAFKNIKTTPLKGQSQIEFKYSIDIDSPLSAFDVELFITPPDINISHEISLGVRKYSKDNRSLEWGPVELNCTSFGNGTYRFKVGSPINRFSRPFNGPYVPICIIPFYNNHTQCNESGCTYYYCNNVCSCINATIELLSSDSSIPEESLGQMSIIASKSCQRMCWKDDHEWTYLYYVVSYA